MTKKKDRPPIDHHVVPQVYLNNFGTKNRKSEYQIIVLGKRKRIKNRIDVVKNVGYIKNFYTIDGETDEEKMAWETFYAKIVEPLYSRGINNVIAKTVLSVKDEVLGKDEKLILGKIIVSQWLRVPNFVNKQSAKAERQLMKFKRKLIQAFIELGQPRNVNAIKAWRPGSRMPKELVLTIINDEERLDRLASILAQKYWAIYYNPYYKTIPFITCDNPIITRNIRNGSFSREHNGIGRKDTAFAFPLSPQAMVQIFPETYNDYLRLADGKRFFLSKNDVNFILEANIDIYQNANREVYLPLSMRWVLDSLNNETG